MPSPVGSSKEPPEEQLAFSVDTHLLRELGSLLVGRDSTALVELIKNAYDADASVVVVHGERLGDHGVISVQDNGHGMTRDDFVSKFLRIAGRSKEGGSRRSPLYNRKYTGAKGIGRLSAHKLGERLTLESSPDRSVLGRLPSDVGFIADIDWSRIEKSTQSIDEAKEIDVRPLAIDDSSDENSGTLLTVNRLHSEWSSRQLNSFLTEVRSTRADSAITAQPRDGLFVAKPMIPTIEVSDTSLQDAGFEIELSGDFAGSEAQWPTLLSHVSWMLEIDARSSTEVRYRITPAVRALETYPDLTPQEFVWNRLESGPTFVSRIFIRDGLASKPSDMSDLLTTFAKDAAGVRLFYEGFRVLPYGTPRNDWLGLGSAYASRSGIGLLEEISMDQAARSATDERTYQLSNSAYFGGVFLHDAGSADLQMVVNREGFLPGDAMDQLTEIVRRGINISVRLRASLGAHAKTQADLEKEKNRQKRLDDLLSQSNREQSKRGNSSGTTRPQERLDNWIQAGEEAALQLRNTGSTISAANKQNVEVVSAALEAVRAVAEEAASEQTQLRVLASLGTQIGAFVHEVNGILGQARTVREMVESLANSSQFSARVVADLRDVKSAQSEVINALERQAVYLSDSIGADARRRRSRQVVTKRWETAVRLLGGAAKRRDVSLVNLMPPDLRTPLMFAAEVNVILTNLLSNAIKAASVRSSSRPSIQIDGSDEGGHFIVTMQNTGVSVDLSDSEKWFQPFRTTTTEVDAALGQGLGLGLSLTRRIIEEYGGGIKFVTPADGMATAVQFWIPNN